jgi:hypothetical protein
MIAIVDYGVGNVGSIANSGGRLVKTIRLKQPVYLGDPINVIRIFNEKERVAFATEVLALRADGRAASEAPA